MTPQQQSVANEIKRLLDCLGETWTVEKIQTLAIKWWDINAANGGPSGRHIKERICWELDNLKREEKTKFPKGVFSMKHVTMNYRVFDNCGPYQFVAPTLRWLSGWDNDEFEIQNLEVTFQLDFNRGEYRVQIIDSATDNVMHDATVKLACALTGDQKNIDDVMGLLKVGLKNDRHVQIQTAVNQFSQWFDEQVSKWLVAESEKQRYNRLDSNREFCSTVVVGYEVL